MAGHNKWSKIKHRKAAVEKKKTRVWTKVAKALMVAARNGGPDPDSNLTLRYAIDEARYANMPRDTIERAIKKGAGEKDAGNFESVRYEGYGPGGVAVVVDALTDNRTRTIGDVRDAFSKNDGNVGASGCVAFMFLSRGQIVIAAEGVSGDRLMEVAVEAGAADVSEPEDAEGAWVVLTEPVDFLRVKEALDRAGFAIEQAEIALIPETRVAVSGEQAKSNVDLIEALEELDDVQKVWTNADFPDEP